MFGTSTFSFLFFPLFRAYLLPVVDFLMFFTCIFCVVAIPIAKDESFDMSIDILTRA